MSTTAKMTKDYDVSDLKLVFNHCNPSNWQDALDWLEDEGVGNAKLTPGEVDAMKEDIQSLIDNNTPFTSDFQQAYNLAHKNRE
jgi:hypothetical protein